MMHPKSRVCTSTAAELQSESAAHHTHLLRYQDASDALACCPSGSTGKIEKKMHTSLLCNMCGAGISG
jgi:hypothetical protein